MCSAHAHAPAVVHGGRAVRDWTAHALPVMTVGLDSTAVVRAVMDARVRRIATLRRLVLCDPAL